MPSNKKLSEGPGTGPEKREVDLSSVAALFEGGFGAVANKSSRWKHRFATLAEILRHPFALLLVSSALIPVLIFLFNSYKTLVDTRQKKALEIVEKNDDFERQLNLLNLDFAYFYKSNIQLFSEIDGLKTANTDDRAAMAELEKKKAELRTSANAFNPKIFEHFSQLVKSFPDSDQNIWVDNLYLHGVLLGLYSAEELKAFKTAGASSPAVGRQLTNINRDIAAYKQNYVETMKLIGRFQNKLFDDVPGNQRFDKVNQELNEKYNALSNARQEIISNLVEDFTPKISARFWK